MPAAEDGRADADDPAGACGRADAAEEGLLRDEEADGDDALGGAAASDVTNGDITAGGVTADPLPSPSLALGSERRASTPRCGTKTHTARKAAVSARPAEPNQNAWRGAARCLGRSGGTRICSLGTCSTGIADPAGRVARPAGARATTSWRLDTASCLWLVTEGGAEPPCGQKIRATS